jgi:hypothetical protein
MNFNTVKVIILNLCVDMTQEFHRNERLRWICAFGLSVLYLLLVTVSSDISEGAKRQFSSYQSKLSITSMRANEIGWSQRALDAESLTKDLRQRMWVGDTPGLAEAGFERWIRQTLSLHGIKVRQVTLTRNPLPESNKNTENIASIEALKARVIASLNESALINFLNDTSQHQSLMIIEKLFIRSGRNDRLEIDLSTFYNNQGAAER